MVEQLLYGRPRRRCLRSYWARTRIERVSFECRGTKRSWDLAHETYPNGSFHSSSSSMDASRRACTCPRRSSMSVFVLLVPCPLLPCSSSVICFRNAPACCPWNLLHSPSIAADSIPSPCRFALPAPPRSRPCFGCFVAANMPARNLIQRRLSKRMRRAPQTFSCSHSCYSLRPKQAPSAASTRPLTLLAMF